MCSQMQSVDFKVEGVGGGKSAWEERNSRPMGKEIGGGMWDK